MCVLDISYITSAKRAQKKIACRRDRSYFQIKVTKARIVKYHFPLMHILQWIDTEIEWRHDKRPTYNESIDKSCSWKICIFNEKFVGIYSERWLNCEYLHKKGLPTRTKSLFTLILSYLLITISQLHISEYNTAICYVANLVPCIHYSLDIDH